MMTIRRLVLFVLLLGGGGLCAPVPLAAQSGPANWKPGFLFGVHYGVPLKWSAVFAASWDTHKGWAFLGAEPGLGGARVSVGYLQLLGQFGGGYAGRVSVLRTNGQPWNANTRTTFVGAEASVMTLFTLGLRVGGFVRVGGSGNRRGLLTADLSVML